MDQLPGAGDQPAEPEMQIQVHEVITYPTMIAATVNRLPDGRKMLSFVTAHAKQINIPLDAEGAKHIGSELMAPGIEIASAVVPNGATPPFQI